MAEGQEVGLTAEERAANWRTVFDDNEIACSLPTIIREAEERGRQAWVDRPLSPEQRTCMEREGLTVEAITSDWADLNLEGEALRERLAMRAHIWKETAREIENRKAYPHWYDSDRQDLQILIDLIYNMERNCTMEAERLRNEFLTSLEPLCETPEGTARLYAEHGHITSQTVIERSAQRKMRQALVSIKGGASEYSEVEQNCKGCMGPCGQCEEPEDEGKGVKGYAEGQIVS